MKLDKWKLFDLLGYKVNHAQVKRFHDSEAKVKVVCCPRRASKSYSAAHDVLDTVLLPQTRTWVVGPSYGLAEKEFRYIHDALVIRREKLGLPKPVICHTAATSGLFIKWPWGAILEGKTADRPDSLLGDAVDRVIYSEAAQLPRAIHERYVAPTLITRQGTAIIATTPESGAEWVYELWQLGAEGRMPEVESFNWDISANPAYPREEFEKAKRLYGEDSPVFREQYLGQWVFYTGLVYSSFQADLHIIEPFDIPASWPRIRGIDFGHRDPFVCLWVAVGPSQELYFYREYHCRTGAPMKHHAAVIKEKSIGENITFTVADSESAQSIDDLCQEGIPTSAADKKRDAGRLRVLEYMMPTEDGPCPWSVRDMPAGTYRNKWPRMYFFGTMKETLREMKFYRWKEGRQVEGDRERTEGEDHCLHPDTLVITDRGKKKIKDLAGTEGSVLTFGGKWTNYRNCRGTLKNQPLVEVGFDDGSKVKCTKDHKFLTPEGWIEAVDMADRYCYDAVSQRIRRANLWKSKSFQKLYRSLKGSDITFADFIFRNEVSGYIGLYGNTIMEESPKDFMSIMKMAIGQTISLPTWCLKKAGNTYRSIVPELSGLSPNRLWNPLRLGIEAGRGESGIEPIMNAIGINYIKPEKEFANIAGKSSYQAESTTIDSVQMLVKPHGDSNPVLIMKKGLALNVEKILKQINMAAKKLAPVNVLRKALYVKEAGVSDVYCMEVLENNALAVENGLVVHNCMDTMRYVCMTRPSPFTEARKTPAYSFNYYMDRMRASKLQRDYIGA